MRPRARGRLDVEYGKWVLRRLSGRPQFRVDIRGALLPADARPVDAAATDQDGLQRLAGSGLVSVAEHGENVRAAVTSQSRLRVVPCSIAQAKAFVETVHRHHGASTSARYALAVADEDGLVRGVALVGRPVARLLDDGWTLEVNRTATDGCPNACSALYGASLRLAKSLGYARLVTYTRQDEPGTSLRAAGWESEGPIRARSWNMPGRPRTDKTEIVRRERWAARDVGPEPIALTWPALHDPAQLTLETCHGPDGQGCMIPHDCDGKCSWAPWTLETDWSAA